MKHLLVFPIWLYRKLISPLKPPCCRFHPTCSQYAMTALRRHGVIRGLTLSLWRILRCQPFARNGEDPVPHRFTFRAEAQPGELGQPD
ncbi:MAG: membrane protein insertion efficiency factor YidD [Planctomycetota bacterium]|jgi:putative membrane protein insertion efficiency factor